MQRKHFFALVALAAILPAPALAGPPVKKQPPCQVNKAPEREAKKAEPCRKTAPIPWVVDPTPLFLASATTEATPLIPRKEPVA